MIIWKDVPVPITIKMVHIRKIGGKTYNAFIKDFGDVPVGVYNNITKQFMQVDNARGNAYAARKRLKYRKNKNKDC